MANGNIVGASIGPGVRFRDGLIGRPTFHAVVGRGFGVAATVLRNSTDRAVDLRFLVASPLETVLARETVHSG